MILKELAKGVFLNARILSKHNVIPKSLGSNFRCCVVFEVPKNFLKKKKKKKKKKNRKRICKIKVHFPSLLMLLDSCRDNEGNEGNLSGHALKAFFLDLL